MIVRTTTSDLARTVGLVNRRGFLRQTALAAGLGTLSAACAALHLNAARPRQLGVLVPDDGTGPRWAAFRAGLHDLGWTEGQNLVSTWRSANGANDALGNLAADLVNLGVDVLVTSGTEAALAAQRASQTLPIVVATANDPIGSGLIASYAHPGGNVTGSTLLSPELAPKWLELLLLLVPDASHVAVLANGENPSTGALLDQLHTTAPAQIQLNTLDVRSADEIPGGFEAATSWPAQVLLVLPDYLFYVARAQLAQLAAVHHLPALYTSREYADTGGLLSYGANQPDLYRRAAGFVDRILNGARPADLPVEQPSTFELVANATTAQQLGLSLPSSILLQATLVQ
jgi:putative ABC transport system substrate-binding protein